MKMEQSIELREGGARAGQRKEEVELTKSLLFLPPSPTFLLCLLTSSQTLASMDPTASSFAAALGCDESEYYLQHSALRQKLKTFKAQHPPSAQLPAELEDLEEKRFDSELLVSLYPRRPSV